MNCPNCGNLLNADAKFCNSCGAKIEAPAPIQEQPTYAVPSYTPSIQTTIPDEYQPISAWKYFWCSVLFSIPIVGFVFLIVFSCGGARNVNLRNFARSHFCGLLIAVIILAAILGICITAGVSFGELVEFNNYYY